MNFYVLSNDLMYHHRCSLNDYLRLKKNKGLFVETFVLSLGFAWAFQQFRFFLWSRQEPVQKSLQSRRSFLGLPDDPSSVFSTVFPTILPRSRSSSHGLGHQPTVAVFKSLSFTGLYEPLSIDVGRWLAHALRKPSVNFNRLLRHFFLSSMDDRVSARNMKIIV